MAKYDFISQQYRCYNDHSELIHILHYFGLQKMENIYNKIGLKTLIQSLYRKEIVPVLPLQLLKQE